MTNLSRIGTALIAALAFSAQAQDAEDYREARRALNRQEFAAAVSAFRALRDDYPDSEYVDDAFYWEAFALERSDELETAVERIDTLLERAREASDRTARAFLGDARALRLRVCSELARRGDSECAADVSSAIRNPDALDDATRLAAVSALMNMPADRAVRIAGQVAANRAQPRPVRRQALFVLADKAGEAGAEQRAREVLRSIALDDDEAHELREQAVFWLSRVPGPETLAVLADLVGGEASAELKTRAVFAISQHGTQEALDLMHELARNADVPNEVRKQAVYWIAQEAGRDAFRFLTGLYSDIDNAELKRQVLVAVSEVDTDEATDWYFSIAENEAEPLELRKQALFWTREHLSAEQLTTLYERFASAELREYLIWLIAERGGDGALDGLMDIARNDPNAEMRRRAVFWIGNSDDPRAEQFLLELLEQPAE